MPRQPLYLIIPVVAVIAALVLFFQRDHTGRSTSSPTSASGLPTGSGANMPTNSSVDPVPAGTPQATDRNSPPPSATPTAPSGEAARPAERR